jgi:hypothetical protein
MVCLVLLAAAPSAIADVVTFVQFATIGPEGQGFEYTNHGTNATFANQFAQGIPVFVTLAEQFSHGLPSGQLAHIFLTSQTSEPVHMVGSQFEERFPANPVNMLHIVLDNPPMGRGSNLLTLEFTGTLGGQGQSGFLRGSNTSELHDTVIFSSDYFDFTESTERAFALSFSSIINEMDPQSGLVVADNGFFESFTASGTGTFNTNFGPAVPEPSSLVLTAFGVLGLAGAAYRRRRTTLR